MQTQALRIHVSPEQSVSALLDRPDGVPLACLVLAHGAGAGMDHTFLADVAAGLRSRGWATLRYQFVYQEIGSRRPDRPPLAHAAVRAAVAHAASLLPTVRLFAGGKSFGGRMTSQAQAAGTLPDVRGLVFFGFPLHPAGQPSTNRAEHLDGVGVPMLFLQGSRDALAEPRLLHDVVERLGTAATLSMVDGADHGFHVPVRSGRTDAQVLDELLDTLVAWAAFDAVADRSATETRRKPADATSITIRPARDDDWAAIHALLRIAIDAGDSLAADDEVSDAALQAAWMEAPLATCVACRSDGAAAAELIGVYALKPNQVGRGSHVANCSYVVSPAARGLGVATRLCLHSQSLAVDLGFRSMQFNLVVSTNTVAVRLWQHLGFEIVGTLPGAFRHRTLGDVDAYVLFKRLVAATATSAP